MVMTRTPEKAAPRYERVIGRYEGAADGPRVVCVGGLHGNEPAGILAIERVLEVLREEKPPFRGSFLALSGNLQALQTGERFLEEDLNRAWKYGRLERLVEMPRQERNAEENELVELAECLDEAFEGVSRGIFLDLHTTSSPSAPFGVLADTLPNREFAFQFPVPIILGFEEQIEGSLESFLGRKGHITFGFEGGQHDDPASVDMHEAALWTALLAAGCLNRGDVAQADRAQQDLERASKGLPRVLEIRYRKEISKGDGFRMEPGFKNFDRVERGALLARDSSGELRASERSRLFMPLYQNQGDDGYFLARRVARFWLRLSAVLRRCQLYRLATWLPGVRRHPSRPETLLVNPKIARWLVGEVFHLLGFRRERSSGPETMVSRRPHDN